MYIYVGVCVRIYMCVYMYRFHPITLFHPFDFAQVYGADVLRLWVAMSDWRGDVAIGPTVLTKTSEVRTLYMYVYVYVHVYIIYVYIRIFIYKCTFRFVYSYL